MSAVALRAAPPVSPPLGVGPRVRVRFDVLGAMLVLGLAYIFIGVDPTRAEGTAWVMLEFAVWVFLIGVAMYRSVDGVLRVSDPLLAILGIGLNFFVAPAIQWLHGADLERQWFEVGRIRMPIFVELQILHMVFLAALTVAYIAVAPRYDLAPPDPRTTRLPSPWPWIIIGLLPTVAAVGERVITTGTVFATENYGAAWYRGQEQLAATYTEGGGALVATQLLSKVWFLPGLSLGIGEGLLLARLLHRRRPVLIALFTLQAPLMLALSSGGRSAIAIPFAIALLLADALAGPLRWRWILGVGGVALVFLNFFGIYRGYRELEFQAAIAASNEQFADMSRSESLSAEGSIMLVKEHYAVAWTDANDYSRGLSYYSENLIGLLPQQIVPQKRDFMNTANFLSHELLGSAADRGGGVAGAIIAAGYMTGRELGVLVLGGVLGAITAAVVRVLSAGSRQTGGRPRLWQVALLMCWAPQGLFLFRNDLGFILTQILSVIVLPAGVFMVVHTLDPGTAWQALVPRASRST